VCTVVSNASAHPAQTLEDQTSSTLVQSIVEDLQSKHLAEKKVLELEISTYQSVVKRLIT